MAGTLHTLVHRHATVSNGKSCQRKPIVPAHYIRFRGISRLACNPNSSIIWKSRPISRTIRAKERSDQENHDRNQLGSVMDSATELSWVKPLLNFAATNFLPIALVSGVALGLANPGLGCLANKYCVSKFSTFGIFLISGLMLQSKEISAAVKAWPAGLFGLVSILLLSPFFSRIILQLKLYPQEFVTGLAIFSCMPTTLSSGVALTQLVGGNSALALAMTVISNLLGIFIVPLSLSKFIAAGVGVPVPTEQLFRSLIVTLLVPLILGKVARDIFYGVAEYVDQNRKLFSMMSAIFLSLVPWMQVSRSRPLLLMVKPAVFFVAIGLGSLLHLILLALNALLLKSLSSVSGGRESVFSEKGNARAVVIVASQKTLPVMVAVVEQLGGALGESGLLVLPCVAAHINQIIIDSFLVNSWLQKDKSFYNAKEA
ncbi:probable sodium/metabolite cotransporter BASS4, chloroplastic isoform X2 [Macadamia integrifolia]|uniref:probable sodium/metabolite cotransporter BASS4, chloroplastic isoform X2 n=1 Tax=Macadamia integrifolia TaxID=60698 RepID=UPI001C4F80FA|nr:probable sodium/metabolite cotransporter BASS4, chloroplastic isoform X2 [Macadamia integrifolia]